MNPVARPESDASACLWSPGDIYAGYSATRPLLPVILVRVRSKVYT